MIGALIMLVMVSVCDAASKKPSELMQIPEFASATPEGRLAWINDLLVKKEWSSSDMNSDVMTRLIMDVLVAEKTPQDQVRKYGEIREKYGKLTSTYDLEKHLVVQFLATDPEAQKADIPGKCKIVHRLNKQNVLSWPGVADVLKGMIALHLATSAEYQAMTAMEKLEYLRSMDGLNIVSNLTSSSFSKGVAAELMSQTPVADQPALYKEIDPSTDFHTKTSIRNGYVD